MSPPSKIHLFVCMNNLQIKKEQLGRLTMNLHNKKKEMPRVTTFNQQIQIYSTTDDYHLYPTRTKQKKKNYLFIFRNTINQVLICHFNGRP